MKTSTKHLIVFLAALLVIAGGALAARKVYNFKGGVKTRADKGLTREDLKPMPDQGGFYTWCYTFLFYTDDGSSGMIQLTYWKLYLLSQHGLVFAFTDRGEQTHLQKAIIKAEDFSYGDDPPELRMGKNYWRGFYPEFEVYVDLPAEDKGPDLKADLVFRPRTPGWRPGEGPVHYGDPEGDWYDLVVMFPWADVSGTVTLNGEERKIEGWGYSDHNTQTVFPTTQSEKLLALRSFSEEYSINFLEYIAPEDFGFERSTWIIIIKDHEILFATDQWERELDDLEVWPKRGYKYPTTMRVSIDQPGCRLSGVIKGDRYIGATDAMDELPAFVRPIAEKFMEAPVFIRQNVTVNWSLIMPERGIDESFVNKGVLETTIVK